MTRFFVRLGIIENYTYDEGRRVSKGTEGWIETRYFYEGDRLIAETGYLGTMIVLYDSMGSPIGMLYHATDTISAWEIFWYEKNLQGDIVAVYNADGVKCVSYTYDAWGNFTTTRHGGSYAATYNPFRYRGYYYDTDLKMYWLTTRLYNPMLRRFMSPDDVGYLGANGDFGSYNLYAYCSNNAVMYTDPSGNMPEWAEWVIIGTAVAVMISAACVYACATGPAAFIAASVLLGGTISGGVNAWRQDEHGDVDIVEVAISVLSGSAYGLVTGLSAGTAGASSLSSFLGHLSVAGGTSLLNSWNDELNTEETVKKLAVSLAISVLVQGAAYNFGKRVPLGSPKIPNVFTVLKTGGAKLISGILTPMKTD